MSDDTNDDEFISDNEFMPEYEPLLDYKKETNFKNEPNGNMVYITNDFILTRLINCYYTIDKDFSYTRPAVFDYFCVYIHNDKSTEFMLIHNIQSGNISGRSLFIIDAANNLKVTYENKSIPNFLPESILSKDNIITIISNHDIQTYHFKEDFTLSVKVTPLFISNYVIRDKITMEHFITIINQFIVIAKLYSISDNINYIIYKKVYKIDKGTLLAIKHNLDISPVDEFVNSINKEQFDEMIDKLKILEPQLQFPIRTELTSTLFQSINKDGEYKYYLHDLTNELIQERFIFNCINFVQDRFAIRKYIKDAYFVIVLMKSDNSDVYYQRLGILKAIVENGIIIVKFLDDAKNLYRFYDNELVRTLEDFDIMNYGDNYINKRVYLSETIFLTETLFYKNSYNKDSSFSFIEFTDDKSNKDNMYLVIGYMTITKIHYLQYLLKLMGLNIWVAPKPDTIVIDIPKDEIFFDSPKFLDKLISIHYKIRFPVLPGGISIDFENNQKKLKIEEEKRKQEKAVLELEQLKTNLEKEKLLIEENKKALEEQKKKDLDLQKELDEKNRLIEEEQKKIASEKLLIEENEKKANLLLQEKLKENEEKQRKLELEKSTKESSIEEIEKKETELIKLEQEHEILEKEKDDLKTETEIQQNTIKIKQDDIEIKLHEVEKMTTELKDQNYITIEEEKYQEQLIEIQKDTTDIESEIEYKKDEIIKINEIKNEIKESTINIEIKINNELSKKKLEENKKTELEEEIISYNNQINTNIIEIEKHEENIQNYKDRTLSVTQNDEKILRAAMADENDKIIVLETKNKEYMDKINANKKIMVELDDDIDKINKVIDNYYIVIDDNNQKINEIDNVNAKNEKAVNDLINKGKKKLGQINSIKSKIHNLKKPKKISLNTVIDTHIAAYIRLFDFYPLVTSPVLIEPYGKKSSYILIQSSYGVKYITILGTSQKLPDIANTNIWSINFYNKNYNIIYMDQDNQATNQYFRHTNDYTLKWIIYNGYTMRKDNLIDISVDFQIDSLNLMGKVEVDTDPDYLYELIYSLKNISNDIFEFKSLILAKTLK